MSVVESNSLLEKTTAITAIMLVLVMLAMMSGFANRAQFAFQPVIEAEQMLIDAEADPRGHAQQYRQRLIDERFQQAVAMLHANQYDFAITALHRVIELAPKMPEAYVNMGYALIGKQDYKAAADFFNVAIELKPYQANAYWGLAVSLEQLGELDAALGAMRTYIHLSPPNDPFLRKARSALWEWESALKRGPLPEAEQEWIERRSGEWQERNSLEADMPDATDHTIDLN
jgi:tetratricopeptide (TPR) repeat protein